jgi:hypothetical protein
MKEKEDKVAKYLGQQAAPAKAVTKGAEIFVFLLGFGLEQPGREVEMKEIILIRQNAAVAFLFLKQKCSTS